jgi:hypothetical protein
MGSGLVRAGLGVAAGLDDGAADDGAAGVDRVAGEALPAPVDAVRDAAGPHAARRVAARPRVAGPRTTADAQARAW